MEPLPFLRRFLALAAALFTLAIGVPEAPLFAAAPGFKPEKLAAMDAAIEKAIGEGRCPGGELWVEHRGVIYHKVYGQRAVDPAVEAMAENTIFDVASLTKVLATAPAVMRLVETGKLDLDAPLSRYLPEFTGQGKEAITLLQVLTHTSGLRPGLASWTPPKTAYQLACAEPLPDAPGSKFRYSDINFILLGELVARVSGQPLEQFCQEQLFGPLQMTDTRFLPLADAKPRIAPTSRESGVLLRGDVHDPTARRMGGVAGHAGLFTTARDMARFCRMLLGHGQLEGARVFEPGTLAAMTRVQTPLQARRGLGWDIDSPYSRPRGELFPLGSFGHTGWTGGSMWIDPFSETFVIFLTNRVHPDNKGNVIALWGTLGTLAAGALQDFDFANVPGALAPWPATPTALPTPPSPISK